MNENKMKTGIICHECKHENRNHGLKHGMDVKLKTVESCFETFNRKQLKTFQRKNVRLKTEKLKTFHGNEKQKHCKN